ncbi:Ribonuclease 1 [Hibiscus syriacus]|uniref:Ribonuclease 1 n=1 Tax=Hibiscus syriacus TaxID=106335 RepID=A0A6A2WG74_HIBSY|nr:Ribonuclease 1 [Hibiscus syriacus]
MESKFSFLINLRFYSTWQLFVFPRILIFSTCSTRSYCDSAKSSCYPTTGKPADFGIHGLWPNYNDGSYLKTVILATLLMNLSSKPSQISDLIGNMRRNWSTLACPSGSGETFWSHEWEKHGTCSESVFDQHSYFETTLGLKQQTKLLQALKTAGINPDGSTCSLENIKDAIKEGAGYTPWIECNRDSSGNSQLYQVYLCLDKSGSSLIECPVFPKGGKCGPEIEFPSF